MNNRSSISLRNGMLLALIPLCCGFGWGKTDPCKEARTSLDMLAKVADPLKREKMAASILKACPDGAAGLFIRALTEKPDAAIARYREVLAKDDTIAEAHGNLGLLLHEKGLDQEAAAELTRGIMGPPDPRYHRALADITNDGDLPALALFHYDQALKAFPDDVDLHTGRAEACLELKQFDKAEEEFIRLKALKPEEAKFRLGLADVYRKTGRLDRAIDELRSHLSKTSDKEGHLLLAEVLMEKGERDAAREEYLAAGVDVTINPDDFVRKGDEYLKAREYGQAIAAYQTALKGRPAWPAIQHKLGRAQMSAGRDDEALVTLTPLIKAGSADGAVFNDLGMLHERSGRLDEAIAAYRSCITHDPDQVNAHRKLAEIYTWRGSFAEAAEQYRELIRLRGDTPLYHLNLGKVYDRLKEPKQAVSEYETAVRLDPDMLEGHRELARIFSRDRQTAKAEHHYKEVLRLQSEDEVARNGLITLYVKQKRYDDLTGFVKDWLDQAPGDPQRHYRLGLVYEFKREYDPAISEYKAALALQPDHARMLLALGRVLMKTGRLSDAKAMLEASKKADPTLPEPQLLLSSLQSDSQPLKKKAHKSPGKGKKAPASKAKPARKK